MNTPTEQRISAFVQLGKTMSALSSNEPWPGFDCGLTLEEFTDFQQLIHSSVHHNGWFTQESIALALRSWAVALQPESLQKWASPYLQTTEQHAPKTTAIICAGNIPLVAFHDVLCTLLVGDTALIKLSSDDKRLLPAFLSLLARFYPPFAQSIHYAEGKLEGFDKVIATGSNNSSRYFSFYFKNYPHIIRKSRTSVAVLTGKESKEELHQLGHDIFDHFGLGCRNVSKLYLPEGYSLNTFFEGIYAFHPIVNHNKYANNYDYNKAVWLLNSEELLDNGFVLLKEDPALKAPTGSLYYSFYSSELELQRDLEKHKNEIQCIVGHSYLPFGTAQAPGLSDYADGINTLQFLLDQ
jgi:hypothetical protein